MLKELFNQFKQNKQSIFFISKIIVLYIALQAFYNFWLSPYTPVDRKLIGLIISQAEWLLTQMGYELLTPNPSYTSHMGVEGSSGVVIGNPCDGLSLFILFVSFLIAFKGKWWFKLIYISFGIAIIHFLNVLRVLALALIVVYSPESLDFHHSYTFTLFIYLIIFLLWMLRIRIFRRKNI